MANNNAPIPFNFDDAPRHNERSLMHLDFSDLYMRVDDVRDDFPARYRNLQTNGIEVVPRDFDHQIKLLRSQIAKESSPSEGTITQDSMRLRYSRAKTIDNQVWASIRRIPIEVPRLSALNMAKSATDMIKAWSKRRGLILIGGQTGVGKTTTAVAMLQEYMFMNNHVAVAIEDPPEYHLQGNLGKGFCAQMEVEKEDDWEDRIKTALRWRPRYIFMGELRTGSAARQALRASTSGHLVITTTHGGSIEETLASVYSLAESQLGDGARNIMSDNLVAVIHQRLRQFGPDLDIVETKTTIRAKDEIKTAIYNKSFDLVGQKRTMHDAPNI